MDTRNIKLGHRSVSLPECEALDCPDCTALRKTISDLQAASRLAAQDYGKALDEIAALKAEVQRLVDSSQSTGAYLIQLGQSLERVRDAHERRKARAKTGPADVPGDPLPGGDGHHPEAQDQAPAPVA